MKAALSVQDVRTWFTAPTGLVRAVDGVSVSVPEGGSLGVVGESGSGKTQTFHSVLGLTRGTPGIVAGDAEVLGTPVLEGLSDFVTIRNGGGKIAVTKRSHRWNRLHRRRMRGILGREVSLIFQEPRNALVPYWTVERHFRRVLRRAKGWREQAADIMRGLGFPKPDRILQSFPAELSGGQAQRVMLAMSLVPEPSVLIADEPTTAVDAVSQVQIIGELEKAMDTGGLAMVFISHDLTLVRHLVRSVVVMFRGHVVERMAVDQLHEGGDGGHHPYTIELRESERRRHRGWAPAPSSVATPASGNGNGPPLPLPGLGCPYAPRCPLRPRLDPQKAKMCLTDRPPLTQVEEGHHIACWGVAK